MEKYIDCCNYILDIPKFAGKNSLEDTHRLLEHVYKEGSAKVVHIAGTNGKGSTTLYLCTILQNMGYKVGMFTSPHLVSINERIKVNNKNISDENFVKCFQDVKRAIKEEGSVSHPSFFEFLFLMAMDYFAKSKVDYIVLETGLGGRLDATNCVIQKNLSVITKIGMDHMEYLGDTLEKIAYEKAGIIKEQVPVIVYDNKDIAFDVIKHVADEKNSTCYQISSENIKILLQNKQIIDFSIGCRYYRLGGLRLETAATYQVMNATLAVTAAFYLENEVFSQDIIHKSLLESFWPGRMEEISPEVYLDGAHNVDGIEAFLSSVKSHASALSADNSNDGKQHRLLLFSVVKDKEYTKMIDLIVASKLFDRVYVAPLESDRKTDLNTLKEVFTNYDIDVRFYNKVDEAYAEAMSDKSVEDSLYIAGSLYLVGYIKAILE